MIDVSGEPKIITDGAVPNGLDEEGNATFLHPFSMYQVVIFWEQDGAFVAVPFDRGLYEDDPKAAVRFARKVARGFEREKEQEQQNG